MTIVSEWCTGGWPAGQDGECGKWNNGDGKCFAVAMDVGRNAARREARRRSRVMADAKYVSGVIVCRNECIFSTHSRRNGVKRTRNKRPLWLFLPGVFPLGFWIVQARTKYKNRTWCPRGNTLAQIQAVGEHGFVAVHLTTSFRSEASREWLDDLLDLNAPAIITEAFEALQSGDDPPALELSQEAIVAAEIVAALTGKPSPDMPKRASKWVRKHSGEASEELLAASIQAVEQVQTSSALRTYWEGQADGAEWADVVENLKGRLKG